MQPTEMKVNAVSPEQTTSYNPMTNAIAMPSSYDVAMASAADTTDVEPDVRHQYPSSAATAADSLPTQHPQHAAERIEIKIMLVKAKSPLLPQKAENTAAALATVTTPLTADYIGASNNYNTKANNNNSFSSSINNNNNNNNSNSCINRKPYNNNHKNINSSIISPINISATTTTAPPKGYSAITPSTHIPTANAGTANNAIHKHSNGNPSQQQQQQQQYHPTVGSAFTADGCRRRSSITSLSSTTTTTPLNPNDTAATTTTTDDHCTDNLVNVTKSPRNNGISNCGASNGGSGVGGGGNKNGSIYSNYNYVTQSSNSSHFNNNYNCTNNNNNIKNNNNHNNNSHHHHQQQQQEQQQHQQHKQQQQRQQIEQYDLYPKDFFSRLEGQAPKASTKMQTKVDAVGAVTGEWGKWQLRTVLLIFLCKIPSSWFMACIIFTAPAPRHGEFFCKPPNTIGAKNQTQWIKVSHPQKEEADDQEFAIDFCNVYEDAQQHAHHYYNYERPELEPKIWEEPESRNANVIPCTQFHHEAEFHSVITQYDLVCSRDILVSVTQFFHLFGVLTGGILANHLLKYFSPRNVMLFGMVTQIFCGNLTGHVASYELHVFFRCLSAVCCAQMYTAGGMIMADITGGKYKVCVSTLFEQFWSIGVILLPGVASFFQSWSHLYMAISWPTVILIYLWQWIPDSPRWMIARGRVLDAKKILLQCVEVNGTRYSLPHNIDQQLQLQAQTAMEAPPPSGWWTLWKGEKAVRHMICVHLCWSIYIVVYYGMLLNIRSFSREHLEINTVIAGVSEIIGTFIGLFLILTTKRKWLYTGIFNIVAGLIAYLGWLVPTDIDIHSRVALLMLSAMVSKVAISTTLSILTTSTVELVSDDKKKICAFSTICWARFWLLGAPFVGATVIFGQLVPQTAFASLAIIGGILSSLISSPRTLSNVMPKSAQATQNMTMATRTTHDIEGMGIDNKGFSKMANEPNDISTTTASSTPGLPIFTSITTKLTTQHSNLPPQLMPGIWTTKNHEDSTPI